MDDRLLTVKQLATYLSVNERTVVKLVQEGTMPGVKVGNQWRFRKVMIDTWLDDQLLGITPRYVEPPSPPASHRMPTLESCFEASHIVPSLQATTKLSVVVELCTLAHQLDLVRDATWFVGALIQRENVMPSAVGNGLAFLHTLYRNPQQVTRPFMILGRSMAGVDFDALDGNPTHLFFVLGLKHEELHLPWLSKLTYMFAQPGVVRSVLNASGADEIFQHLADLESTLFQGAAGNGA